MPGPANRLFAAEAYALAITLFGLRGFLTGRSVIAFIDNDPCRMGLIKRYSPSLPMMGLISLVSLLEGSLATTVWYERGCEQIQSCRLAIKVVASGGLL